MTERKYYMQDSRQYVGNSMYWWAKNSKGYTCDIKKAHVFTLEEAKYHSNRDTDKLWPVEYIKKRISHHIDCQHCNLGTGVEIAMNEVGEP